MMQKAVSFHQKGQITEAEQSYQAVLAIDPQHVDALRLLGGLYVQSNKAESAISCFEKALSVKPDHPELLNNLGVALYSQGKLNEALQRYQQAATIAPDYFDAVNNLGNILFECGKLDDAVTWLERSIKLKSGNISASISLGQTYRLQNKKDQAIACYKHALSFAPDNTEILTNLGNLLREMGKSDESCAVYQRLAQLKPGDTGILLNFGTLLRDTGKWDAAMEQYEKVLELQPNSTDAIISRASLLLELNRPEEAKAGYSQSLNLKPNLPDAKWGKAAAALMLGEYTDGWALYESRFECAQMRRSLLFRNKRWAGGELDGKRLLIWGEQGFGDVLQFIRYAALCKEKGGYVIALCREPLVRLLKNCPYIDEVVTAATEQDFDYQAPIMSLPHIFGTTLHTVPNDVPYLYVSETARQKWAPHFADADGFKLGLVWSGNPRKIDIEAHMMDRQRSMSLALMKPFFDVESCRFYNLQKGEASDQIAANGLQTKLIDLMPGADDFMDTAAIIENLDLVISVDTSVVHLAGGLGKPVWVLSRFGGCWRWLQNAKTSPWYPTAKIFGQPKPGDWQSCIDEITVALRSKMSC